MPKKILIVEDEFIVANDLAGILQRAGYDVCEPAASVAEAQDSMLREQPDLVLLDIQLKGPQSGIDLAMQLHRQQIAFVFLSANSNRAILEAAKATHPYGFLVKPFREKDLLVMLDIAWYQHQHRQAVAISPSTASGHPAPVAHKSLLGESPAFVKVLEMMWQVAPTNTSVLILGETGTGKELIANELHHLSPRQNGPLVKVNCAALPPTLIESELFGHERGAFTGAMERRIGKFEQAAGGTLFLDEIGEMLPELQVKFLRVLQEKEIERIGGRAPVKVDVRIVAATNRNLEKEIAEGRFRLDLYYRLHIFPLVLPPLRERMEDIPLLAHYFVGYHARKTGKNINGIAPQVLRQLQQHSWPGNIRELDHAMERSVLLSQGNTITAVYLPPAIGQTAQGSGEHRPVKTIQENERDHILAVLKQCNGKIWGPGGAAELLDIPPSTLQSKMKKLGIRKSYDR